MVTNGVDSAASRARAALPLVDLHLVDTPLANGPRTDTPWSPFVVAVGRLGEIEGLRPVICAPATVRRNGAHRLVIVGEGSEWPGLERFVGELEVIALKGSSYRLKNRDLGHVTPTHTVD